MSGRSKAQMDTPPYPDFQEHVPQHEPRRSPSPTHNAHSKSAYTHKRKDSDTVRSTVQPSSASPTTVEALPARFSPSARTYLQSVASSSAPVRHRRSPTAPEPPTTSGMLGPHGQAAANLRTTWAAGESVPEENVFGSGGVERGRLTTATDPPLLQQVQQPAVVSREQQQPQQAPPPQRAAQQQQSTRSTTPAPSVTIAAADTRNRQIIVLVPCYSYCT